MNKLVSEVSNLFLLPSVIFHILYNKEIFAFHGCYISSSFLYLIPFKQKVNLLAEQYLDGGSAEICWTFANFACWAVG